MPYQFIAIEGNIGAGKTTISKRIATDYGFKLILEQFTDNPFLPFFYENAERYAFPVELFFMTERHKQLQQELAQQDLFQKNILADYFFLKTLLFARNNLNAEEFRLFQRLFHILNANFPKPELLVYLHRPVPNLLENIKGRGRSFEEEISPAYLEKIQHAYFDFFKTAANLPILILDVEEADFLANPDHYQSLLDHLSQAYSTGVHRIKIA
ncbi:MAG: deoxynucleoside kinase [Saprospiraceae bacterium]|nr:deoxynucleoside kinase [Saprospiraceae bacterium]